MHCRKKTEDLVLWIQLSYSGIVNYSEMPIPNWKAHHISQNQTTSGPITPYC